MAAGGVLLFLGLLCLASAQDPYGDLPEGFKRGVDLAFEQLKTHTSVQHHFRFFKTLEKAEMDPGFGVKYLYHHFHLKPTTCAKGTTESNPERCPFRNNRPLMDCAVCYKTLSDEIEHNPKPYVHCLQKPRVTADLMATRKGHCTKMTYNSGAPTLLAVSTG